jgi:hypothetical protein
VCSAGLVARAGNDYFVCVRFVVRGPEDLREYMTVVAVIVLGYLGGLVTRANGLPKWAEFVPVTVGFVALGVLGTGWFEIRRGGIALAARGRLGPTVEFEYEEVAAYDELNRDFVIQLRDGRKVVVRPWSRRGRIELEQALARHRG